MAEHRASRARPVFRGCRCLKLWRFRIQLPEHFCEKREALLNTSDSEVKLESEPAATGSLRSFSFSLMPVPPALQYPCS